MMDETHYESFWFNLKPILIVVIPIFLLFFGVLCFVTYKQVKNLTCDIGQNETVGDYTVKSKYLSETHVYYLDTNCAVRDCLAFNDYQKSIGGLGYCVV